MASLLLLLRVQTQTRIGWWSWWKEGRWRTNGALLLLGRWISRTNRSLRRSNSGLLIRGQVLSRRALLSLGQRSTSRTGRSLRRTSRRLLSRAEILGRRALLSVGRSNSRTGRSLRRSCSRLSCRGGAFSPWPEWRWVTEGTLQSPGRGYSQPGYRVTNGICKIGPR